MFGRKPTKILHPSAVEFYHYHAGPRIDPGASAEVFQSQFQDPVISFRGAGRVAGSLRFMQPPQMWFRQQLGINGLGGIQAGQFIHQPLLDPVQLEGE